MTKHRPTHPSLTPRTWRAAPLRFALPVYALGWAGMLAVAAPALAAGEEGAGNPWLPLLWKAINLAVLIGLIAWFARKPVSQALTTLARQAQEMFAGSRTAAENAQASLAEQKRKIEGLQAELKELVAKAQADTLAERQRLLAEAQAHAERLLTQARQQVAQEFTKARSELVEQLANETVRLAEELVRQQATDEQRRRIVKDYIARVGERS